MTYVSAAFGETCRGKRPEGLIHRPFSWCVSSVSSVSPIQTLMRETGDIDTIPLPPLSPRLPRNIGTGKRGNIGTGSRSGTGTYAFRAKTAGEETFAVFYPIPPASIPPALPCCAGARGLGVALLPNDTVANSVSPRTKRRAASRNNPPLSGDFSFNLLQSRAESRLRQFSAVRTEGITEGSRARRRRARPAHASARLAGLNTPPHRATALPALACVAAASRRAS